MLGIPLIAGCRYPILPVPIVLARAGRIGVSPVRSSTVSKTSPAVSESKMVKTRKAPKARKVKEAHRLMRLAGPIALVAFDAKATTYDRGAACISLGDALAEVECAADYVGGDRLPDDCFDPAVLAEIGEKPTLAEMIADLRNVKRATAAQNRRGFIKAFKALKALAKANA